MPFDNLKNYFEDIFSSVMSQFKKYHPCGNLKFNYLGLFGSNIKIILRIFLVQQCINLEIITPLET